MFGLGWAEILIICIIGLPVILFAVIIPLLRKSSPAPQRRDELADLRAQIADLRDEVERLKRELGKADSGTGITADGPK